jgi:hypothetical protein
MRQTPPRVVGTHNRPDESTKRLNIPPSGMPSAEVKRVKALLRKRTSPPLTPLLTL